MQYAGVKILSKFRKSTLRSLKNRPKGWPSNKWAHAKKKSLQNQLHEISGAIEDGSQKCSCDAPPRSYEIQQVSKCLSGLRCAARCRSETAPLVSHIARELGLSSRQLQRRFLAAVGVPPKRFVRVLRFARVWQLASIRPPESWAALAAAHGYADQAHMVREFRAFGADPPTRLFTPDWHDTTALSRVTGPAQVSDPFKTVSANRSHDAPGAMHFSYRQTRSEE